MQVWVCTELKGEVCFASKAIAAYRSCHLEVKASRIHCPKLHCFDTFIILSCGLLKNSKCRERLFSEFRYLLKDRTSKRNSMVADPLQEFHQHGKRDLSLETRIDIIPHTSSSQTITPHAHSSEGPLIFLKVIYLLLRDPHLPPLSLRRRQLSLNSEPPWGVSHFSLCTSVYTRHAG